MVTAVYFKGADSLLDISSETDQQDLLQLLQAKISSLTLRNKELQDKLQVCIKTFFTKQRNLSS